MKSTAILLFVLLMISNVYMLTGQNEYDPSETNPYGIPNPESPTEIRDYEAMIGICECVSNKIGKNGNWSDPVNMTWTFQYILNGKAVQDYTITMNGSHAGSIRQYNLDSYTWYVHNYKGITLSALLATWQGG